MLKKLTTPEYLNDAPSDQQFYAYDGTIIRNLDQLHSAILTMDSSIYSHHVNEQRNDFYNWIKDVIGDEHLANQLLQASSHAEAKNIIENRMSELKSVMAIAKISEKDKTPIASKLKIQSLFSKIKPIKTSPPITSKIFSKPIVSKTEKTLSTKHRKIKQSQKKNMPEESPEHIAELLAQKQPAHLYTGKEILREGLKDFFLGLFIGIVITLLVVSLIQF